MVSETYRTVAGRGMAERTIRQSTFRAEIRPSTTVEVAEKFLDEVAANDPSATHHVPAYRVRVEGGEPGSGVLLREYQSDAGEPTGSAGPPALNVLQGQDLENVAVVVTRHYGGTDLGVGGLARAYSDAVTAAIEAAGVVTTEPKVDVSITVSYDDSGTVRRILDSEGFAFEAEYDEVVEFTLPIPEPQVDAVLDRVRSGTSGRATIQR